MAQITPQPILATTNVFQIGNIKWKQFNVVETSSCPKPLLVFTPIVSGTYPVILFCHGFCVRNSFYSQLLGHITSHGFIVVAPQLFTMEIGIPMLGLDEVKCAGKVVNWIAEELQVQLNNNINNKIEAKLDTLILAGHSRGGKTAFSVALGYAENTKLNFSSLIGIDPVAGLSKCKMCRTLPHILTEKPQSFNLDIPIIVIGTGLGPETSNCVSIMPCAPEGVNHNEFVYECKPPCAHFVTSDYGHMDMLDDDTQGIMGNMMKCMCKNGIGSKDLMRRTIGGLVVAFLKAHLSDQWKDFNAILEDPSLAPAKLDDPVVYIAS